jgi:YegS/Rv2252/BmrU family lipid kinase
MHRKIKIILNPMADMGNAWRTARDLRSITEEHGGIEWSGTVYPGHAIDLARSSEGYDLVIAMGGDGTVHEVMNGIMEIPEGKRPVLGVVPVGTGNDFGYAINASSTPATALKHAIEGEPSIVDIGLMTDANGRKVFFDNSVGMGFGAIVSIRAHQLPLLRGFLAYLVATLQSIILDFTPITMQIETDTDKWKQKVAYLEVCNGQRIGGGYLAAPDAKIDDGVLDYVMIKDVSRPMMFRILPEVMKGTHVRFKQIIMGTCKRFNITADRPLYIHTDGEIFSGPGSDIRKISFEILPNSLKVVRG